MADSKITDLSEKTSLDGTEELVANDGGADKKITIHNLASGQAGFVPAQDFSTGRYYMTPYSSQTTTSTTLSGAGVLTVTPFFCAKPTTFTRIGINVATGGASALIRLGIYKMASNGLPGALVLDAGTVDASTSGEKEITISQELYGNYYLASVTNSGTTPSLYVAMTGVAADCLTVGAGTTTATAAVRIYKNSVTGALPDPFGTPLYVNGNVFAGSRVWLRVV